MKRDDDLVRALLLEIEESDEQDVDSYFDDEDPNNNRRHYHFTLMQDAGLAKHTQLGYFRLTSAGHDYLDTIRNADIWTRTKNAVAETGGSATLEILKQLATGFLKKKISQHTGIDL